MKRIALISLFLVYSLSSLGIGVEEFYCCGKLKSVSITLGQFPPTDCEDMGGMKDCCITSFVGMDVEKGYVNAGEVGIPPLPSFDLPPGYSSFVSSHQFQTGEVRVGDLPSFLTRQGRYLYLRVLLI